MAGWSYETLKRWWNVGDDEPVITDASGANNYIVESDVLAFQEAAKAITDKIVEVSAANEECTALLEKYRDAVTEAYTYLLDANCEKAKKILEKVVNK